MIKHSKYLKTMDKLLVVIGGIVLICIVIVFFGLLFAFPTMWLWNWLMPLMFKLGTITVWQAWGLNVLTGLLFRSTSAKFNDNDNKR